MPEAWNETVAREMREAGVSWCKIGARFGMTGNTVKRKLDPEWHEHCRRMGTEWKRSGRRGARIPQIRTSQGAEEGWRRHLENIRPDDRDPIAVFLGDPPSWRSALGQKQQEAQR